MDPAIFGITRRGVSRTLIVWKSTIHTPDLEARLDRVTAETGAHQVSWWRALADLAELAPTREILGRRYDGLKLSAAIVSRNEQLLAAHVITPWPTERRSARAASAV